MSYLSALVLYYAPAYSGYREQYEAYLKQRTDWSNDLKVCPYCRGSLHCPFEFTCKGVCWRQYRSNSPFAVGEWDMFNRVLGWTNDTSRWV